MMQGELVREVRKKLGLTLDKFGERIGIKKSALSSIENGKSNLTDANIKAICREFNVNPDYLMYGKGEMFSDLPQTVLDDLCRQYNLDDFDKSLVEMYITFPEPMRKHLKEKLKEMVKNSEGNVQKATVSHEPTTEELEAEYKKSVLHSAQNTESAASNTTVAEEGNKAAG